MALAPRRQLRLRRRARTRMTRRWTEPRFAQRSRFAQMLDRWSLLLDTRLPRGAGLAAAALVIAASLAYGAVKGDHVPDRRRRHEGCARRRSPMPPASASSRSRSPAITTSAGRRFSPPPASPAPRRSSSSTSIEARERLKTNPWIADATVLKLYPGELQIGIKEREAFALWQKDGRVSVIADDGTVLEPYVAPRPRPAAAGGRQRGADASEGVPRAARSLSRDARSRARRRSWSASGAGTCGSRTASTCCFRKRAIAAALERLVALDREKNLITRDIVAIDLRLARPRHGAALGRGRAGPHRRAQGQAEEEGRQRMSALQFGLTPKMKPLPPKRSVLVAALDVGTSKIACMIGAPQAAPAAGRAAPAQPLRRCRRLRPHARPRHEGRRR